MISRSDASDTFSNAFDDARTFVAENDGENRFRVLSRQQVRVRVAQGSAYDSNAHLSGLRERHLHFLHDWAWEKTLEDCKTKSTRFESCDAIGSRIMVYEPKGVLAAHATARV